MSLRNVFRSFTVTLLTVSVAIEPLAIAFTIHRDASLDPIKDQSSDGNSLLEVRNDIKKDITMDQMIPTEINNYFEMTSEKKISPVENINNTTDFTKTHTDEMTLSTIDGLNTDYKDQTEEATTAVNLQNTRSASQTNVDEGTTETIESYIEENVTETKITTDDPVTFIVTNDITSTPSKVPVDSTSSTTTENSEILETTVSATDITETLQDKGSIAELVQDVITYSTNTSEPLEVTTTPPWRKYSTIERPKSVTKEQEDISKENTDYTTEQIIDRDMSRAHSAQAPITIEKAFGTTPEILSLEELKNNLILDKNKVQSARQNPASSTIDIDENIKTVPYTKSLTESIMTTTGATNIESRITNSEVLTSSRGGFLDLSVNSSINTKVTTITREESGGVSKQPDEETEQKKATGFESQSQLIEDAIKEELMKEEMLYDIEENAKRYRESTKKLLNDTIAGNDTLTVKPINHEKTKAILYTVNSNYKPMKKIEVLPPKQFVRDPDDNSWRNESISSLGIVFNPKNSSKPLTQVLKNKTELEWNIQGEKDNKTGDTPELRARLEKIAEIRKSRKKKIDAMGNVIYSDYEEGNISGETTPKTDGTSTAQSDNTLRINPLVETLEKPDTTPTTTEKNDKPKVVSNNVITRKPKKFFNIFEYYDTTDEDDDYISPPHIDLKKFITTKTTEAMPTFPISQTKPSKHILPERKPTIQYFPPRVNQKVNVNDYDDEFNKKVNMFTYMTESDSKHVRPSTTTNYAQRNKFPDDTMANKQRDFEHPKHVDYNKNVYLSQQPVTEHKDGYVNDGNFDRASYVIKHYRDFINEAVRDDYDRPIDYVPNFTKVPMSGITAGELREEKKHSEIPNENYDYDAHFKKDVLERFVDNFNQNSERFKVDFPVLYNTSVVHRKTDENGNALAASNAFVKRLYGVATATKANDYLIQNKMLDPNCENMTVELSPAYELHYYVPEQEEKQEMEPPPVQLPYRLSGGLRL